MARNEPRAVERKRQLPPRARSEACSREKRNKWQGPASGGKDAVYVGFDLEQAQRSATEAELPNQVTHREQRGALPRGNHSQLEEPLQEARLQTA